MKENGVLFLLSKFQLSSSFLNSYFDLITSGFFFFLPPHCIFYFHFPFGICFQDLIIISMICKYLPIHICPTFLICNIIKIQCQRSYSQPADYSVGGDHHRVKGGVVFP